MSALTSGRPHPTSAASTHSRRGIPAAAVLVDCVVRSDALVKAGGDTVQVREYSRHLTRAGIDLREVPFHPGMSLREGAVVHIFNVDRPFEFLLACRAAAERRVVVSPIHHRADRVRAMRAADTGRGLVSLSARVLPEAAREWAATTYRAARGARSASSMATVLVSAARLLPAIPRVWRLTGRRLDQAAAVALLAEGEGRDLRALTGWTADNALIVPNGRPGDLAVALRRPWSERPAGSLVVVGRIEPRKRQVELARRATALGIPVRFVGAFANEGSAYADAFRQQLKKGIVRHDGALDRGAVLELLGRSRVLLNASWVEVQSLVDLEAATMGCAVLTGPTGHSREWLGAAVTAMPDDDLDGLLHAAVVAGADGAAAPPCATYERTWEQAAAQLEAAYRG